MDSEKEGGKKPAKFKIKKSDIWKYSTGILAVLLIISALTGGFGKSGISADEAANTAVKFINDNMLQEGMSATINKVEEKNGVYAVDISIQGKDYTSYVTKDGKMLFTTGIDMSIEIPKPAATEQPEEYSEEDIKKIKTFVGCLEKKNLKIYGANWCGWTKRLVVQTLGGFDVAKPIYVECTEDKELCSAEGIEGYPTIKVDGEPYTGGRTFEALSEATGCPVPKVRSQPSATTTEASCS